MMDWKLNRNRKRQQGFTFVELLIVVIILAILAAAVVPQFASSTDDAKLAVLDGNLANMRGVLDLYYAQHGEYPSSLGDGTNAANSNLAFLWQLSRYTDAAGDAVLTADATHVFGPYLKTEAIPLEPMTNSTALKIEIIGTPGMTAEGGDPGGWRFDNVTGQFIVNHSTWDNR
jgi:general secretion pathway protein G